MNIGILSPKNQIVIPKAIRKKLNLRPGQQLQFSVQNEHIEIQPILPPEELVGFLKGPKPLKFQRDGDREF
jgi:AbrB family looped-hinge helix DNA binding protein